MNMKKYIYAVIVIAVIVLIAVVIKNNQAPRDTSNIRIGAVISQTGFAAAFGEMSQKALEMAVEEINSKGGIKGRKVELIIENDQTDPKEAVAKYKKLVDVDRVDAVIGSLFDFTTQPLIPLAEKDKKVLISPTNLVIDGSMEMNKYTFVMYPRFEKVIRVLKDVLVSEQTKKVGILRYQSDFGLQIEKTLNEMMSESGKEQLVAETYSMIGKGDFRTQIAKLKQSGVDTIFLDMLDGDLISFAKQAKELGLNSQLIAYTTLRDAVNNIGEGNRDLFDGYLMLDWEVNSDEFIKLFEGKYGIEPLKGANRSYAAVYVLANTIANVGNNSDDMVKYMESNTFKTIDGEVGFNEDHVVESTPVRILEVKNGELVSK